MTPEQFVENLLKEGMARYEAEGKVPERFVIDLVLDWKRLNDKERQSLKHKRKLKKERKACAKSLQRH